MDEIKLNPTQSWSATLFFLDSIWEQCKDRFSDDGYDELATYLSCLSDDPASLDDWKSTYKMAFGKELSRNDLLTQEEIFTTMIEITAMFFYKFGYNILDLVHLLFSMRYKPDEYKKEWELWQRAISRVLNGHVWKINAP